MEQPYEYQGPPRRSNTLRTLLIISGCSCVVLCMFCCIGPLAALYLGGGKIVFQVGDEVTARETIQRNEGSSDAELTIEAYSADIGIRNMLNAGEDDILAYEVSYNVDDFTLSAEQDVNAEQTQVIRLAQPEGNRVLVLDNNFKNEWSILANPALPITYDISNSFGNNTTFELEDAKVTEISAVSSGDISILLDGDFPNLMTLKVDTFDGAIKIEHNSGALPALQDFRVDNLFGPIDIILGGELGTPSQNIALRITGEDGAIDIDLSQVDLIGTASLNIESNNGDISILLPNNAPLSINAESEDGSVSYEGRNEGARYQSADPEAILTVEITSSKGDIKINHN